MKPLQGQHALVSGANRGIGAAIVRHLAGAGADVSLLVRTAASAEPLAAEVRAAGGRAVIVTADVTDTPALRQAIAEAERALGPVHVLVNNAGTAETVPFLKSDEALFQRMLAMHLLAPMHASQAVLPGMLARGEGRIVNVASIAGLGGGPYIAAYVSAKHAEMGLTRALAAEFAGKGIKVNAVCAGYVDTDLVTDSVARIVQKTGLSAPDALATILKDSGQPRLATVDEVAAATMRFALPSCVETGQHAVVMGGPA